MSNLTPADKQHLENALRLDTGFVLNFNEKQFVELFEAFNIDINDLKYSVNGTSKANRMRTFWKLENNYIVGQVILELASMFKYKEIAYPLNVSFSTILEKIGNRLINMPDKPKMTQVNRAKSIDSELNMLIEKAQILFSKEDTQGALEKIWDAYERLKTIWSSKKEFSDILIQNGSRFRKEDLETELSALTHIGNSYQIRHFEKDKIKIENNVERKYLYHRMLSLLTYCISIMSQENLTDS